MVQHAVFSPLGQQKSPGLEQQDFFLLLAMCGLGVWLHSTYQWFVLMVCAAFSASPYTQQEPSFALWKSFLCAGGGTALSHSNALTLVMQKSSALSSFPSLMLPSAKTSVYLIPLQFTCQADQWRDSWADWSHLCISH